MKPNYYTKYTADVDGDITTTFSSSADLILPEGSTIVKAFLAIEKFGNLKFTSVKLKVPGASYISLTDATSIANRENSNYFQMIWDITDLIPENGYVSSADGGESGRYFLADPTPFPSNMGGWSITVVYKNPNSKHRQIVITDGWKYFSGSTSSATIQINGVKIPASGVVNAMLGMTGTYGDRGSSYTDTLGFGKYGTTLTLLKDPMTGLTNDALNSSIAFTQKNNVSSDGGPLISGNYTARNPISDGHPSGVSESYYYDLDIFDASGILSPSPNPIDVYIEQKSSSTDYLISGSYFLSIDLATPPILTKSLSSNTIKDGEITKYIWTITNTATDAVSQTIDFTDNLPQYIKVAPTPNISITGGLGGVINAEAGSGAVTVSGVIIDPGESVTISVDITNVPTQLNTSCLENSPFFTNSASNISIPVGGILDISKITPQCLIVRSSSGHCYKLATTNGISLDSKNGITAFGRAGKESDNWPMVRKGAWTVLESKEKGFVINRVSTTEGLKQIINPIEGMIVYDEEADCLKIFTTKEGETSEAWHCFDTQACPD